MFVKFTLQLVSTFILKILVWLNLRGLEYLGLEGLDWNTGVVMPNRLQRMDDGAWVLFVDSIVYFWERDKRTLTLCSLCKVQEALLYVLQKVWNYINERFCSSDHIGTFLFGGRNNKVCVFQPVADLQKLLLFQIWRESSLLVVWIYRCCLTTKASFYPFLPTLSLGSVSPCPRV